MGVRLATLLATVVALGCFGPQAEARTRVLIVGNSAHPNLPEHFDSDGPRETAPVADTTPDLLRNQPARHETVAAQAAVATEGGV